MDSLRPLAASQALFLCAMGINLSITALAGARLSSHPTLATVPMAVIPISNVIFAPSVNRILHRRGPRTVGVGGAALGALGGLLATFAVVVDSLPALIIAMIPAGAFQAVANYYRYLAADLRPGDEDAAVSRVLATGVVAAVFGPLVAAVCAALPVDRFAAAYFCVFLFGAASVVVARRFPATSPNPDPATMTVRAPRPRAPLVTLLRRPAFLFGAVITFTGCATMTLIMSAAPIHLLHGLGASLSTQTIGMQLHIVGMYGPILLIPTLLARMRRRPLLLWTTGLTCVALLCGLFPGTVGVVVILFVIGCSWALLYTLGSAVLTTSYAPGERSWARGLGELFPVIGLALGSVAAGPFLALAGWRTVLGCCLGLMVCAFLACAPRTRARRGGVG